MRHAFWYLLLALILAIGVLLVRTHIASGAQPAPLPPEQKAAVGELLDYGGVLLHRDERRPGSPIVLVDFTNHPAFRDEWLKPLAAFPELENVGLAGTALTDAGIDYLVKLPKLQTLTINDTTVTDAGAAKLAACRALVNLDARGTRISTDGLAALHKALPQLHLVTDAGAAAVDKAGTATDGAPPPPAANTTPAKPPLPHVGATTPAAAGVAVCIPTADVAALREKIGEAMQVPESTPEGWSKSTVDPMKLLAFFPALRMRDGFTLRAYQFKEEGNGNGFVWAMPKDAEFPAPEDCPKLESHFLKAPKPYDALDDVMEAIEGDDTHEAYWQASLLRRELKDFGALWHGVNWGTHYIVETDPLAGPRDENADPMRTPLSNPSEWRWLESKPTDWCAEVMLEPDRAVVTFYTYSGFEKEAIYRHVDVYRRGKYRPRVEEAKIAEGQGGWMF